MGGVRVNILEFALGEKTYAIKADYVKAVFEVEEVERVPNMPDYMLGLVRHNEYVYPLVCTERFLEVGEGFCKDPVGKIAIGISYKGGLFAFLAERIVQIREVEKAFEDTVVDYHNKDGQVIMEISPEYFDEKAEILTFSDRVQAEEHLEEAVSDEEIFLLVKVGNMIVALPSAKVRKVEEIEDDGLVRLPVDDWVNRVYAFNGRIVKLGNLKEFLKIEGDEGRVAVIVGTSERCVGLIVDDIVDMLPISRDEVCEGREEDIFCGFFMYGDKLVSVLSSAFLDELVERYALKSKKRDDFSRRVSAGEKQILIVKVGDKRLAVDMDHVLGIIDYSEANISACPSDNPYIKGIVVTKNFSHVLYALDESMGERVDTDEAKILIFKDGECEGAFLIDEVEDLITVPEDKLKHAVSGEHPMGGVVDKDGELLNLINLKCPLPKECKLK